MDDDMSTPIDQLPGPQVTSQMPVEREEVEFHNEPKVRFNEIPVEIEPNLTFDVKKRELGDDKKNSWTSWDSWKDLFSKKTLYETLVIVAMYVLLGQPFVVYRLGNVLGTRFGSNISLQLFLRGLLLAIAYYVLSTFVLPKFN